MTDQDLQDLVRQTVDLTGAEQPAAYRADAATLDPAALRDNSIYFVGLIGGKEVGKSALVNALAGAPISQVTSHGPGTEHVVAYVHRSHESEVRALLDREVPGRFRLVPHDLSHLSRQVLLDLPDVDSRWTEHLETTRRMLRHMLFPIWVQSVEKYADRQPQELLAKVAAGNDPANFVFCLNKVDQVGPAKDELTADFAVRIARTLRLPNSPRVFAISAINPQQFDLPDLQSLLSRQKSESVVIQSRALANRQRERSLLIWLQGHDLPGRAERLSRLSAEADELIAQRVGVPLLEQVLPSIAQDPGHRLAMIDEVLTAKVARWPVVNVLHTALSPLLALVRTNVATAGAALNGHTPEEALVEAHLQIRGRSVGHALQTTFAQLQQSHPAISPLFRDRRYWESLPADEAAADLCRTLADTVAQQRTTVREKLLRGPGLVMPLIRFLLTVGAIIWFPILQPLLERFLLDGKPLTPSELLLMAVQLLGVTYLLKSVVFLLVYFLLLWLLLRWDAARRVDRLLNKWAKGNAQHPALSLAGQTLRWMEDLTDPLRQSTTRLTTLVRQVEALRLDVETRAA